MKSKIATKKGMKFFLPQIGVFLLMKKCISYILIYENYVINIFLTKIKIMFF